MIDFLKQIDTDFFLALNSLHNEFWDIIMYWVSEKLTWLPLYALIIYLVVRKFKRNAFVPVIFIILTVALADIISVNLFKNVLQRLRPCHNELIVNFVHLVNGHCGGMFSFISSHAANTFGVAVFTSLLFSNKGFSIGLLSWAFFVSYSRIYLGVHYPGDVLCGALFGSALAIVLFKIYLIADNYLRKKYKFFQ